MMLQEQVAGVNGAHDHGITGIERPHPRILHPYQGPMHALARGNVADIWQIQVHGLRGQIHHRRRTHGRFDEPSVQRLVDGEIPCPVVSIVTYIDPRSGRIGRSDAPFQQLNRFGRGGDLPGQLQVPLQRQFVHTRPDRDGVRDAHCRRSPRDLYMFSPANGSNHQITRIIVDII